MTRIKPVILAGGMGTRLWPLSTPACPKQFSKVLNAHNLSLFQTTLIRNSSFGKPTIITLEQYKATVIEQLDEINVEADLIIEPQSRNTAVCTIIAALVAQKEKFDKFLLLPSDHYIEDVKEYVNLVERAININDTVCTIGIKPYSAHTGYGYIEVDKLIGDSIYNVARFIEKPNKSDAEQYLKNDNYFWNSGIYIFNVDFILEQAQILLHDTYINVLQAFQNATIKFCSIELDCYYYQQINKSISVDYAIIEHISELTVLVANLKWYDLGSWQSLWQASLKDCNGNFIQGNAEINEVSDSYIKSDQSLTVVTGLDNVVVINTGNSILVTDKAKLEDSKQPMNFIPYSKLLISEEQHVTRPWGRYRVIEANGHFKIKKIILHPLQKTSLQYHNYRTEYWVVVKGNAEAIVDDKIFELSAGHSICIQQGSKHRLINTGSNDLELIETQIGRYLGEDDIVRIEDMYGRTDK